MLDREVVSCSVMLLRMPRQFFGMGALMQVLFGFIFNVFRPPGVFEFPAFSQGSKDLLDAVIEAATNNATVIVGGGDTATVVANYHAEDKLSHVSTGGGARHAGARTNPPISLRAVTALQAKTRMTRFCSQKKQVS